MPSPTLRKYWTTSSLVTPRAGKTTRSGLVTRTVRPRTSSSTGGVVAAAMPTNLDRVVLPGEQEREGAPCLRPSGPPVAQLQRPGRDAGLQPAHVAQPAEGRDRLVGIAARGDVQGGPHDRRHQDARDEDAVVAQHVGLARCPPRERRGTVPTGRVHDVE